MNPSSTPSARTCRDCGAPVADAEHEAVQHRFQARFPGMSLQWAYCPPCATLVEDMLACLRRPGGGRRVRRTRRP